MCFGNENLKTGTEAFAMFVLDWRLKSASGDILGA
jgi:hypothetical protein